MFSNSEVAFMSACDDLGAEVEVSKTTITILKGSKSMIQARKVVQSYGAEKAPSIAKAVIETLDV